ncbi:MAG: hypothetical protein ACE5FP_10075 [Gemmatimonadota bacterium]
MEDFFWIFILLAFWLFEIVGKAIKKQKESEGDEPGRVRPDPRSARRDLARDVDEGARRAEDALRRRDELQRATTMTAAPSSAARRRDAAGRRQAFEAIAAMLAPPPEEPEPPPIPPSVLSVDRPRRPPAPAAEAELPQPPAVRRREQGGLRHLEHLPIFQRAVVLNEVLGPPVSLSRRSAGQLDAD